MTLTTKPLKMVKLSKDHDHFPKELEIRGRIWERHMLSNVYQQIKRAEKSILEFGEYKAIVVKKAYDKQIVHSENAMYGLYVFPLKIRRLGK